MCQFNRALEIRQGTFYRYIANFTKIEHLRFTFSHYALVNDNINWTPDELMEIFPHRFLIDKKTEELFLSKIKGVEKESHLSEAKMEMFEYCRKNLPPEKAKAWIKFISTYQNRVN